MKLIKSFGYAWNGILLALKDQANLRIQFVVAVIVVTAAAYLNVTPTEWIFLMLSIGMVISLELINSAIEGLTDLVSKERNPIAGKVKDIAAAAVFFSSIIAVIIGVIIFAKYIF